MLKDDRMMSMFTFIVVLMAIGTAVQRFDLLEEYFGGEKVVLEYQRDEAIVRANTLSNIDVLANDRGLKEGDAKDLVIVEQPKCGRVFSNDGVAQYLPAERCVGSQTFRYAISGYDREKTGEVIVNVRIGEPTQSEVAADAQRDVPTPAPMAPRASEQRVDDTPAPALLAAQSESEAGAGGLIIRTPEVPRPSATTVAGLPDTASGAGSSAANGGSATAAGVTLDGSGQAPSLSIPSDRLTAASALSGPPQVPQSEPEASAASLPASGQSGSAIPESDLAAAPRIQRESTGQSGGLDLSVPRPDPAEIGTGGNGKSGLVTPAEALAAVRGLGNTSELATIDTTPPAALNDPNAAAGTEVPQTAPSAPDVAPVPCTAQPVLTLDIRPAGITEVIIDSPCHVSTTAELSYDTLRLGIALDPKGAGSIAAVGFQQASDAKLRFADGEEIDFNIPFIDTEKLDRIALVWEMPVKLELNAFEFGADPGGSGHVRSENPRSHRDVRRQGGGYLLEYPSVNGVGQNVDIYSYWHRNGGRAGVVKLKLGIEGPKGAAASEICGDGALASPDFTVVRSAAGRLERSRFLRLAPLDCTTVAGAANLYISDAVDDLIVLQR